MFALVTQADGTSRGQPWVTLLLAAALVGGFVADRQGEGNERRSEFEQRSGELVEIWFEHPYLELDSRILGLAGGREAAEERLAEWNDDRRARGLSVMPPSIQARTQARFDRRVAATFDLLSELPSRRNAVVDRTSPSRNWLTHFAFTERGATLAIGLIFTLCLGAALEGAWGSLLFAPFAFAAIGLGGALYAQLHGALGLPWMGATGLAAALAGAYAVQGLRWPALLLKAFPMPGWLIPLVWFGVEYGVARGLRPDTLSLAPFAAHGALFGFGVGTALVMRALGVEKKLKAKDEKSSELMTNPVLDRAMAAQEAGRSEEAFGFLQPEVERNPGHRDLAVAFWTVCCSLDRTEVAAPVLLRVVRDDMKVGRTSQGLAHWKELAPALAGTRVEVALLVRLGEALLDASEPQDALHALGLAVDGEAPLPSALAIRVVRVARDLDPGLTARAARRALDDPQLDPARRDELAALSNDVSSGMVPAPASGAAAVETPAPIVEEPIVAELTEAEPPTEILDEPNRDAFDTSGAELDSLDPDAISGDALSLEADTSVAESTDGFDDPDAWNDVGRVDDLSAELPDDAPGPEGLEYDPTAYGSVDLLAEDSTTKAPAQAAPAEAAPAEAEPVEAAHAVAEVSARRPLRAVPAVPLSLEDGAIKLDVEGKGKTRLAFDRIEALGVSAVSGIGARPVLIIDLALNWIAAPDEQLKVIRLRSDRFNPAALVPGADSPTEAMRTLLESLLDGSGAAPLPDESAARGRPFAQHPDLVSYQRDVLMAE